MTTLEVFKIVVTLISGGAFGVILTNWFKQRASKTRNVLLIERFIYEMHPRPSDVITFVRKGQDRVIDKVWVYHLTLKNTSGLLIKNAHIQFEFSSEDIEYSVARPALSNTPLMVIEAKPTSPWKRALRWQIPTLLPSDSVEFSFQVVEPENKTYETVLDSNENVILKVSKQDPEEELKALKRSTRAYQVGVVVLAMLVGSSLTLNFGPSTFLWSKLRGIQYSSIPFTDSRAPLVEFWPQTKDESGVWNSELRRYVCADPVFQEKAGVKVWCDQNPPVYHFSSPPDVGRKK